MKFCISYNNKLALNNGKVNKSIKSRCLWYWQKPPLSISTSAVERWQSGWMHRSWKPAWVRAHRGFESHPLRHLASSNLVKQRQIPLLSLGCVDLPASQRFTVSHIYSASFVGWFVGWRFNCETYKFKNQKPSNRQACTWRTRAISNIILSRARQMDISLYAQQKSQGNGAW